MPATTLHLLDRLPDERLIALVRAGSAEAFAAIVRRHRDPLLAFARGMLRSSGVDAEDVVQDALIRAHAALRADDREIVLRPWLFRIVRNRALDGLRAAASRRTGGDEELAGVPGGADPSTVAEGREALRTLTGAVAALPERQRAALVMHLLEGRSHHEVASTLDTSVQATKSLVLRAREGLVHATGAAA